jgi:P-type Cu+ transporter
MIPGISVCESRSATGFASARDSKPQATAAFFPARMDLCLFRNSTHPLINRRIRSRILMQTSSQPSKSEVHRNSETKLRVDGMTCSNCVRRVTEAIQSVPGVRSAAVDLATRRASVQWSSNTDQNVSGILAAVEKVGFKARSIGASADKDDSTHHNLAGWQINLWIGIFGTLPLMVGEWVFNLGMMPWFGWLAFGLAGMVQIFAGAPFYRGAWNQLKAGHSNMDTLVVLGSTTAFAYSTWALFSGSRQHTFFLEAASIITLISVGHWIESRVGARASDALRALLNLAPQTARRIQPGRAGEPLNQKSGPLDLRNFKPASASVSEVEVAVSDLKIGDRISLRPGDRIPTDGEVVEGNSAVNEAMLTGESVSVNKSAGSGVFAGTVNVNSRLVVRVTATGDETALAHIIAAVKRAQTSRANIQRIGDRVSSIFVPVVVGIALLAGLWWGLAPESAAQAQAWLGRFVPWHGHVFDSPLAAAFIIAAAVLIIACPCAMGLATPAAIMAGSNAAARRGILIRDGVALEKAGDVTAVIFDKTGTLTFGKPEVAAIGVPNSGSARFEAVQVRGDQEIGFPMGLAASLARHSTHPISEAIAKLSGEEINISEWREVPGAGVEGYIQHPSRHVRLGSLRWLWEEGVELSSAEAFISEWSGQGATMAGLAEEKTLLALFAIQDTVKPGSAKVIRELQARGLKTFLLTGDTILTATSIARRLGIHSENVFAEVRPEQKAEFVKRIQTRGEHVAFVGDGINDAPALEQADLGIAVSRASDVAREAADIILLNSEIEAVPECLALARATLRTIKQNLFWAFFYNALGVPLAAMGFMSPILCAAAMGFSDLIVIGNALRLARWRSAV